jgi:Family of unknown function (DUF6444)
MNAERPFSQASWEQAPAAGQEYIRVLEARVMALESAVQCLEATVQQMTERLRQDSRTSSRPPSSDPPQAIGKRPRREPRWRRPGRQPCHEGQMRVLLPVEEVDVIIPVKPMRCLRCQQPLQGEDPQPQRHQVTEIPPAKHVVTEYRHSVAAGQKTSILHHRCAAAVINNFRVTCLRCSANSGTPHPQISVKPVDRHSARVIYSNLFNNLQRSSSQIDGFGSSASAPSNARPCQPG